MRLILRARRPAPAAVLAAGVMTLGACNVNQELLSPQQPGVISPASTANAAAADALYLGVIGRVQNAFNGGGGNTEALWNWEALFSDELSSSDTRWQENDDDQRNLQTFDNLLTSIYNKVQQVRGYARSAINALLTYDKAATGTLHVAEMYMVMGYTENRLGADFCNGIPLGETVNGVPQYTAPLTDSDVQNTAIARFDTALTYYNTAASATSGAPTAANLAQVRYAILVARARAQVDQADFAGAATTVGPVPTSYNYNIDYSTGTQANEWWTMGPSVQRYTAGDSVWGGTNRIFNAIPFARVNDPRVPVTDTKHAGEDLQTDFVQVNIWGQYDPVAMFSGVDARLIEAEAKLQTGDYAGMMTILNTLRSAGQTIGSFKVAAMPALTTTPTTRDDAINLFFREKALWQFGRGYRMDDLRRLVRQYGRTQDNVFPNGAFFRGGNYGTEVAFPVPDAERTNPLFNSCIDTKA